MLTLRSYVGDRWIEGGGTPQTLLNPATEAPLASASSDGVDVAAALDHARSRGGPALRAMSFAERGALLGTMAKAIQAHRDELLDLAVANGGNTRSDAKFDVEGAVATLSAYAELGASLGTARFLVDGEGVQLGRSPRFHGQHVCVPRTGVAVHINAFNFPAWGFAEKAATALLAGMPVLSKPATSSAMVAHRIMEIVVEAKVLPEGALSLLVGSPRDLPALLGAQDVLAFTGSGDTGARLRALPNVIRESVRINVEADSLNAAVLGPDVEQGGDMYELFLKDVQRDITQKAGQKCTAIRRVIVPAAIAATVRDDLIELLGAVRVGNPARDDVRMGPLATAAQLADARGRRRAAGGGRQARVRQRGAGRGGWRRRRQGLLPLAGARGVRSRARRRPRSTTARFSVRSLRCCRIQATRQKRRRSSRAATAAWCPRCTRTTRAGSRRPCSASRRITAGFSSAIRRSSSRPGREPCCRSSCTAARDAPAAARSSAARAASRSTCSASRSKAHGR